jgi:hypothetical protein
LCSGSPSAPTSVTPVATSNPNTPVVETPVNETPSTPTTPTIPTIPTTGGSWINVVGDTGWCGSPVMGQLARLMDTMGGEILWAGDLAYDRGTIEEFRRCFDPDFGRFRSRFWATPGNHEYMTPGAAGYFTYFGERAGSDRRGYYAMRLAAWLVLMLDSNQAMNAGSAQYTFVRTELDRNSTRCTLAVWHHPFDSSGPNGPNASSQRGLWELLHSRGVDLVVSGHDHLYERHAPQDANQRADPSRGIRLFISGGGGAPSYQRARAAIHSELMISTHGLLRLKLDPALYEWEFYNQNGSVLDRGLNICH